MDLSSSGGSTQETYHRGRKRGAGTAAAVALGVAIWAVARRRPFRVEVRGDSMVPTLWPGDRALATPTRRPRPGHVVVVEHPTRPGLEIVKRVTGGPGDLTPDGRILGPDEYWVEGDNPARSTDSRQHGAVQGSQVKARVWVVYWPPSGRRLVRGGGRLRA